MSAGANNAVNMLARMLTGISTSSFNKPDEETPDFSADFEPAGDHEIKAIIELPSGDTYRVTVEWLSEDSP